MRNYNGCWCVFNFLFMPSEVLFILLTLLSAAFLLFAFRLSKFMNYSSPLHLCLGKATFDSDSVALKKSYFHPQFLYKG